MKNKKIIWIIAGILVVAIIAIVAMVLATKKSTPIDTVRKDSYIHLKKMMLGYADIDLYSTGSGDNERLYLGIQPDEYYITKDGDVYFYSGPTERNAKTGEEYGMEFVKMGHVDNLEELAEILVTKAEEKPFTNDLSNGTSACTLTINGTSYDTCADLFLYVNAYTN